MRDKVYIVTFAHLNCGNIYVLSYAYSTKAKANKARDGFVTDIMRHEDIGGDAETFVGDNSQGQFGLMYQGKKGTYSVTVTEDEVT